MKKLFVSFILIFLCSSYAKAQYFQTGQDPSSIRWKQINTGNFQVIYPEEFEKQAQRISFVFEQVYKYGANTLNFRPRKVSVILHTRTVNSNGLLAWAPKRIELFTTPHQQTYAQDWLEQLALHEFRHLVQMDKIQSELPMLVKALFGEQATAMVAGVYLPFWFLEGDAVVAETALSTTGRGRQASFSADYRALLIEKKKFSFDKAYLGSYKDYVPNHYQLGYWMVAKSREKFGPDIWSDALRKIGKQPFSVTPLNSSLKRTSGNSAKQLYSGIFDDLKKDWKQELLKRKIDSFSVVSPGRKFYTEYLYPEFYRDSLLFAYRTSINDIGRFVLIGPGKREKVIYTPGTIFEESVSLRENLIIWAERRADLRWTHSDRSVIRVYNIENKLLREIKHENKLFSPVVSPDLKSFAAVEVDPENNFFLSVFDLGSGRLKDRFKTADNQYFITPCWDEKGEKLFAVCLSSKGKYLASLDLKTKKLEQITSNTFANLKNPVYSHGQLIFSADFSGVDLLYSCDILTKKITQVVSVPFGASYPAVSASGNRILFSNYTSMGNQLAVLKLSGGSKQEEISSIQLKTDMLAQNLAAGEKGVPDFSTADSVHYQSRKYSKLGHLFNFHSWAPAYIDVNSYETRPGISLFSQNKLGTAETRLGYDYNAADRTGRYKLAFNYYGWFPEIGVELSTGNQASNYYQINKGDTTIHRFTWSEMTAELDVRLPLNLSKGKYSRIFYPEVNYTFNQVTPHESAPDNFNPENYHAMAYRVFFYNLLHQSGQNLMPKWGQVFDIIYRHTPFIGRDLGTLSGIQSTLYFPGLWRNAGIKVFQGYQEKQLSHTYSEFVRSPRGFQSYQNNKMYSSAVDYKFPLFYPDFSIGKLAYIKRLKSSLFYDYAWLSVPAIGEDGKIYSNQRQIEQTSLGIELTADFHAFRFFAPLELGCRSVYRPDFGDFRFDFLFSIDFNGF